MCRKKGPLAGCPNHPLSSPTRNGCVLQPWSPAKICVCFFFFFFVIVVGGVILVFVGGGGGVERANKALIEGCSQKRG